MKTITLEEATKLLRTNRNRVAADKWRIVNRGVSFQFIVDGNAYEVVSDIMQSVESVLSLQDLVKVQD